MMPILEVLRDALLTVPGVETCKIGLEANISPADYPLIRIVPSRSTAKHVDNQGNLTMRKVDVLIYFGLNVGESENGLEAVYTALSTMESDILARLMPKPAGVKGFNYIETIADEDRLDTYKLMAVRCEAWG